MIIRRRAVEPARQGDKPLIQLATDRGISRSCLQTWMAQADADGGPERLTSAEKKELAELRRHNKQLEMENDILKRALRSGIEGTISQAVRGFRLPRCRYLGLTRPICSTS